MEKKWLKENQWLFQEKNPGLLSCNQDVFTVIISVTAFQTIVSAFEHKKFLNTQALTMIFQLKKKKTYLRKKFVLLLMLDMGTTGSRMLNVPEEQKCCF